MYASADDLRNRLGAAVWKEIYPDGLHALEDLADAQAEIDGAVGLRYELPVTDPAAVALLRSWTLTLAEERAYTRASGARYSEKVKSRASLVRTRLDEIRREEFRLPGAKERASEALSFLAMDPPVFGRDTLKRF